MKGVVATVAWWRWLLAAVLAVGVAWGGYLAVDFVFDRQPDIHRVADFDRKIGRWIGILERSLILLLAVPAGLQAIAWVLAAKSIARYPAMQGSAGLRSDVYLVGTLLSVSLAAAAALGIRALLGLPLA